jgi:hypothetical protein
MSDKSQGLAKHIRTTALKHLVAQNMQITPEAIEQQGRYILALWHANNARDFSLKDMAELFLNGVAPVVSIDDECKDLTDLDEDDFGQDVIDFINSL